MEDDQIDPWTLWLIKTLDEAQENSASLWLSFDGTVGFTGVPRKLEEGVYALDHADGGTYTFFVLDVRVVFDSKGKKQKQLTKGSAPMGFRN